MELKGNASQLSIEKLERYSSNLKDIVHKKENPRPQGASLRGHFG